MIFESLPFIEFVNYIIIEFYQGKLSKSKNKYTNFWIWVQLILDIIIPWIDISIQGIQNVDIWMNREKRKL